MQVVCDAKLSTIFIIFFLVYNKIDTEFNQDLPFPTVTTPKNRFLQMIKEKKTI